MGKIDDMRRLREAQHAEPGRALPRRASAELTGQGRAVAVLEGRCSACGKLKPLQNGLVASHQKGLGKACPGTRKLPA
jgi:hypothetical protein